jgi:hypothetical protein
VHPDVSGWCHWWELQSFSISFRPHCMIMIKGRSWHNTKTIKVLYISRNEHLATFSRGLGAERACKWVLQSIALEPRIFRVARIVSTKCERALSVTSQVQAVVSYYVATRAFRLSNEKVVVAAAASVNQNQNAVAMFMTWYWTLSQLVCTSLWQRVIFAK